MFFACFYSIILFVWLIILIKKKKSILGIILIATYFFISVISLVALSFGYLDDKGITLYPYLLLLACIGVFMYPFYSSSSSVFSPTKTTRVGTLFISILLLYLICTVVHLIDFLPKVLDVLKTRSWSEGYLANIHGETEYEYSSFVSYFATQISSWLGLFSLVISFLLLREKRLSILAYSVIFLYVLKESVGSIYVSSRGLIFQLFLLLVSLFIFVYKDISKTAKRIIILFSVLVFALFSIYLVDVTTSRFSSTNAFESIVQYMGQPPIHFNLGVNSFNDFYFGKITFGKLFGDTNSYDVGNMNGFFTFAGLLYLDFGSLGTLILGFVICFLFMKVIRKKNLKISDVYIIFLYFNYLLCGSLVIGRSQIIIIFVSLVLYLTLKIVESLAGNQTKYNSLRFSSRGCFNNLNE